MNPAKTKNFLVLFAVNNPKTLSLIMLFLTSIIISLAVLPNIFPQQLSFLAKIKVDTDPENMLSAEEPVRIYHNQMKQEFSLSDMVVIGIVNEHHPQGVFNPQTLARIHQLSQYARTLSWDDPENPTKLAGVIAVDMLAPSMVDNIEQGGLGEVKFSWLMPTVPTTDAEAIKIRERAQKIPFLNGTLLSNDGKALALYLPLTDKHLSYQIREKLLIKIAEFNTIEEQYYITGLPVAEDTFGVEMFYQMAQSAPLAMLVIFLLLWWFFKRLIFVVSPMIVAMVCALSTMGILIISGHTIHIMSSMIPIFIMPIAVLDAIHILSDFFDRYAHYGDKRTTLLVVMNELFTPMLYTTLTTIAGFASLALTPIPPVQVFGLFIALGVFLAWLWTITFIPAFIMFISDETLASFCNQNQTVAEKTLLTKILDKLGIFTFRHAKFILFVSILVIGVAGYGITKININDNPIKWFQEDHPIRIADKVMNQHFGGTYMAYLALEPKQTTSQANFKPALITRLAEMQQTMQANEISHRDAVVAQIEQQIEQNQTTNTALLNTLRDFIEQKLDSVDPEEFEAWDAVQLFVDQEQQKTQIFKDPIVLNYISELQQYLQTLDVIGKSNSLADVVKTVHRELFLGADSEFKIPTTANAVAQTLITYQGSHRPQDLWHFVTPNYRKTNIWIQLTSGDNQDMSKVEASVAEYITQNPLPHNLQHKWFGLTHINVTWQDKMVTGMLEAFLSSFIVVLIMMIILFRSFFWGILSMIPLTITVGLIYGIIGLIGKDYDMPAAVLSALSIGLAVDYSIHFISRARFYIAQTGTWQRAIQPLFGEPARAIARNAIVVGIGFLPLLAAPLMPYKTVGFFIAAILSLAGISSLLILPALITLFKRD